MDKLPIIDISKLPDEDAINSVAAEITNAASLCGFFYISGHGIKPDLIDRLRAAQRALFQLDTEVKNQYAISLFNRGYLAQGEARMHGSKTSDQKEVFFWGAELDPTHPDIVNETPLCGPNQWPSELPDFKDTVLAYAESIRHAGNHLLQAIAVSLGAPTDFFTPYFSDSMLRGQLIRYPHTTGGADNFGVAPHSDFGCITLLLQETDGLEVLVRDQWIPAPPIEGTLVVNIGDLLERWSDNRLPSTRHRVNNQSKDARYSIAMFHDPAPTAVVDPCDLDPRIVAGKYEPVRAADYILGRNRGAFAHYADAK